MIVTASAMTKVMAEVILENNVPVILFNRFIPGLDISTVYVDAVNGATTVAEYLYQKRSSQYWIYTVYKRDW